jgi:hypothetical protein
MPHESLPRIRSPTTRRQASVSVLVALAAMLSAATACAQVTYGGGPFQGPDPIPGLEVTLAPDALELERGAAGVVVATLRNGGNATLDLAVRVFVHEPPREGGNRGFVIVGSGPSGDGVFNATVSNATLQLAPHATRAVTIDVRAAEAAPNGTQRQATFSVTDDLGEEPEDAGPGSGRAPPRGMFLEIPLRVAGTPEADAPPPRTSSTPSERDVPAAEGLAGALAAVGAGALIAWADHRRAPRPKDKP